MSLISILIPAFNAAEMIERAIRSAQWQADAHIEIIVVDDASTDATPNIIKSIAETDSRVRYIRMKQNGGPGAARNAGLAVAKGEWIALLDADDSYHPDRLVRLLHTAQQQRADMVSDNLYLVRAPEMVRETPMFSRQALSSPRVVNTTEFVVGNTDRKGSARIGYGYLKPMIRAGFLRSNGISYHPARFSEDYLFALRCLIAGARYVVSPQATYDYTVSAVGLTVAHSAADLTLLIQNERAMLQIPAVKQDASLTAAICQHIKTVDLALGWFNFATAIKSRAWRPAMTEASRSPAHFRHISQEAFRAIPKAMVKFRKRF